MTPIAVILLLVFFWLITLVLSLWVLLSPRRASPSSSRPSRPSPARPTKAPPTERVTEIRSHQEPAHGVGPRAADVRVVTRAVTHESASETARPDDPAYDPRPDERARTQGRANDRAFERFVVGKDDDLEF